jgi:hypothetical protein
MSFLGAMILTAGIGFALGAVIGRWLAVVVAGLAWPVYVLGIWIGLWGHGFSKDDTGSAVAATLADLTSAAIVGAMLGVLARKSMRFATKSMLHRS